MKTARNLLCSLCMLVLLSNCQSDAIVETQQEETSQKQSSFKTTIISKQDIEANEKLNNKMNGLATVQNDQVGKNIHNEMHDFTIDTYIAKLVESNDSDKHSYTFPISRENYTGSTVENLVLSYIETNDDYKASLIMYHFTALQKQQYLLTGHVNTPYEISHEYIELDSSSIISKSIQPCIVTYQEFHNPQNSNSTYLHSTNGTVQNTCDHENDLINPCNITIEIEIFCPGGGSSGTGDTTDYNTPPTNNQDNSTTGGGGDSNGTDETTDDEADNIITSPITREESIKQSIEDCINGLAEFNTTDTTTIDSEILEQLNLPINLWNAINDYLSENGCSEELQEEIIEFLENEYAYPYPHCSSFEYAKPPNINTRACAVTNFTETFYTYGELDGEVGTIAATVHYELVFFVMPTWMTNGHAATNTAIAVNEALQKAKEWFYINYDASEEEIITYLDSKLIEQMAIFGGTKTDIPPFNIPSPAPYVTSLFTTGNCN